MKKDDLIKRINELKQDADEETVILYDEIINELNNNKKYGLVWDTEHTKEDVVLRCEKEIPILVLDDTKTVLNGGENNLIIEGDNYHSLVTLNMIAKESVDVIYIDPPYNTGHEDFVYNDRFVNEDDGYRHSKWLSFMDKRLRLAKDLLKKDGVIYISIDDNEHTNLKLLCDEIFGSANFMVNMIITTAPAGTQSSVDFAQQHAYCLVYRKSHMYKTKNIKLTKEELDKKYNYGSDVLGNYYIERIWKRGIGGRKEDVPSLHFPVWFNETNKAILIDDEIENEKSKENYVKIIPYQTKGVLGRWTWSREKMKEERDHLIVTSVAGEWKLHKKVYSDSDQGKKPYSIIGSNIGRTELGSLELKNMMGDKLFDYPKYSGFIKYLVSLHSNKECVVLDFFAGSGTTGQAVLELNKEDGGNRKFILCTNNENNICEEITYQRIKTVITGKRKDNSEYSEGLDGSLYYFKTDFINDENNTDQAKYNLVEKVDSLLCIKEDLYIQKHRNKFSSSYTNVNEDRYMFIYNDYYNENSFNSFKEMIKKTNGKKTVYVFSTDNIVDETLFDDIDDIEIKPIPSKIYEIYKEIAEDIKRG